MNEIIPLPEQKRLRPFQDHSKLERSLLVAGWYLELFRYWDAEKKDAKIMLELVQGGDSCENI